MFKLFLFPILLIPAWSQTTPVTPPAPEPPACLVRPVTQGSVTLSCTLLETNPENAGSDFSASELRGGAVVFQVSLSTADPDVIGFRVGVTFQYGLGVEASTLYTAWGSMGKSPATYAPAVRPPASPYYRYTFLISSAKVTGIQVQELKASSSQTF